MKRTAKRPSVTGAIPFRAGMYYAAGLYLVGFGLLAWRTNLLVTAIGLVGAIMYTLVYGYAKRRTYFATHIGAIPGALPPVAGYVAATKGVDVGALLLFSIMYSWQIPHFYAIAIFRLREYERAKVPVLPSVKGLARTVWEMRLFGTLFIVLCFLLSNLGYEGFMFGLGMIAVGLYWLAAMMSPDWRTRTDEVSRLVFKRSLLVLMSLNAFWVLTNVLL